MERWICLGLQELRLRRTVRYLGAGLRLARHEDFSIAGAGRQDSRGEAAYGTATIASISRARKPRPTLSPRSSLGPAGLRYRGTFDGTLEVVRFAENLEKVCIDTVEGGDMTRDLAILIRADHPWLTTNQFLDKLDTNLQKAMAS